MSTTLARRIRRSLAQRGALGTSKIAAQDVVRYFVRLRRYLQEGRFDRRHGVETRGMVFWKPRHVEQDPAYEHAVAYQGVRPNQFRSVVGSLAIEHKDFTFIDIGCGKGKALLLACEYPFRKIVGVELSADLVAAARRNVKSYRSPRRQCREMDVVCQDAGSFSFPEGPGVYYLFNPFHRPVMERVLENLGASIRDQPRQVYLVYLGPLEQIIEEAPFLDHLARVENTAIFRTAFG